LDLGEHIQADLSGVDRVGRCALQDSERSGARCLQSLDRAIEFGPSAHPAGEQHRLTGLSDGVQQLWVVDLARRELPRGDADSAQQIDGLK